MLTGLSPSKLTLVDLKVAVGNWAVSRKSALWIWPSNISKPVSIVVMSIVTSTLACLASWSRTTVPVVLLKRKICLDMPMWSYENRGKEWVGSSVYVCGAAGAGPASKEEKGAGVRGFVMGNLY